MKIAQAIPEDRWLACQREFIEGRGELHGLAEKYGVKYNTIRRRACEQGWGKMRRAYKEKLMSAPPAMVAEQYALAERPLVINGHAQELFMEGNTSYLAEIPELTQLIIEARTKLREAIDFVEAQGWAGIYDKLSERKRILMGIPLPAPIRQREKQSKGSTVIPVELSPLELEKS